MSKLEILAPAGSEEALISAVRSGADAVYLATTSFGARASAKNFDYEQLKNAVEFCHKRGVKVYLTMNTLITDSELTAALNIAKRAYELPVDAIIVQDVGFADLLHKSMPALHLHGSTQMSVHTPQGAKLLYEKNSLICDNSSFDGVKQLRRSQNVGCRRTNGPRRIF